MMYLKLYRVWYKVRINNEPVVVYFDIEHKTYSVQGGQPCVKDGKHSKTEQLIGVPLTEFEQSFGGARSVYRVKMKDERNGKPVFKPVSQCTCNKHTILDSRLTKEDIIAYAKKNLSDDSLVTELPFDEDDEEAIAGAVESEEADKGSTPYEVAKSVGELYGVKGASHRHNVSLVTPSKAERDELENLRSEYFDLYAEYDSLLKRAEYDHEKEVLEAQIKDMRGRVAELKKLVLSHNYDGTEFFRTGYPNKKE